MNVAQVGILAFGLSLAATANANLTRSMTMALITNSLSDSYTNWKDSEHTPENIFHDAALMKDARAWTDLCQNLASLTDENLALFEDEISHEMHAQELKCRASLLRRLAAYWTKSKLGLDAQQKSVALNEGFEIAPPLFSSEQRMIDAQSGPILISGGLKAGEIALTFDDGPHPTRTDRVLQILKAAGIRATFFQVGARARQYPAISREVLNQGHTVGSHSFNHADLRKLALKPAEKNIIAGMDAVTAATGIETPFFRFPYGARTKALVKFVQDFGLASFLWNIDSSDWKLRNPVQLLANIKRELNREKGGIILFHDIQEQTVIVLPHVLEELKARNFKTIVYLPQTDPPRP